MTSKDLRALAEFLPVLEKASFKAGVVRGGDEIEPGVLQMPFVEYDETVDQFVKAAYKHHWIDTNFNWPEWAQTPEAAKLRDDDDALRLASFQQLRQLLTVCIRQDRFCDGALLDAFESGLILRVVRRAAALAHSPQKRR